MIEGYISMGAIRNEEEFKKLAENAKADTHGLFLPTHVLRKKVGQAIEPVGYLSIGNPGAVITFGWFSTKEIKGRETFHLINMAEDLVALAKQKYICFPVPKHSPLHPFMEKIGYKNTGSYDFFVKDVGFVEPDKK